jgi:predicted permease
MINAILPVFLLIVFGYALKRYGIFSHFFWNDAEKLAYYILFPALLISKMSVADLSKVDILPLASSLLLGFTTICTFLLIVKPLFNVSNASFTSIFQGTMRFNTYIGFAFVENLFGSSGLVIAVIVASILIPAINVVLVLLLQYYAPSSQSSGVLGTLKLLLKNPLIVGCTIGIMINLSGIPLPQFLFITINVVGSTVLPIGLMCVGAALVFKELKSALNPIAWASIFKFTLYPCIAYISSIIFDLDTQTTQIAVIFCALPTASAAYILSKNMGGDHQLMARLITFQTLLSGLTLFITSILLKI